MTRAPLFFWTGVGALFGFLGVAAGAFGAHALAERLSPRSLSIWQTAAQYQMFHALALVALGLGFSKSTALTEAASFPYSLPAWSFALGILVFSGSLYLLALTDIRILGAITPLGGLLFLVGWCSLAWIAFRTQ